jgi:hypothetical protein
MRNTRSDGPPRDVVVAFAILFAVCMGFAIYFMAAPVEPFGFFKDLGFNWEVIDWATHRIRSPVDAFDAVGWSPWTLGPLYFLNSYLGDLFGTIVAWCVGNAWLAVKIVEVVQTIVAGAGAYAMYATASRSRTWPLVFAFAFATLPETAFTIRWNEDFGWIAALLPWCLAISRRVLRRFGTSAIPLTGILAAASGYLLALQFLAFATLPLFALTLAGERRRLAGRAALAVVPIGFVCCVAAGAFFVIPTFVHPILSDSAQRSESLASGAFLHDFSLDWIGLLTLVEREWAASPVAAFTVGDSLPWLAIPSAVVWLAAIAHVVFARDRERTWSDPISVAIVVACTILALGSSLPFGAALWAVLYKIPHVDGIRTADRFFTIVPMMVLFWATCACERFAGTSRTRLRAFAYAAFAVCVAFAAVDHTEHAFTLDYSKGIREPDLDAVREIVVRDGMPVASFADVNGGASEDAPVYGRPQPISWATTDLGSRFVVDGLGASGVLGRAGVGDVVSAPNWTYDAPGRPNVSNIYRLARRTRTEFASPENVTVSRIPHRDDVGATDVVCVHGGPGAFDLLAGDPAFAGMSFDADDATCDGTGFVDYDPADDWKVRNPIDAWSASALMPDGDALRDVDYPILFNRTLLNVPWYRNAVDGDRPVFDATGAIRISHNLRIALPRRHAWPAGSQVLVRIAAHDCGHLVVTAAGEFVASFAFPKAVGYRWYAAVLRRALSESVPVGLAFDDDASPASDERWSGVVLDGVVVLPPNAVPPEARHARFVAASLSHLTSAAESANDAVEAFGAAGIGADVSLVSSSNMMSSEVSGARAYVARSPIGRLSFRWNGPPGRYVVSAEGWLGDVSSSLGVLSNGRTCCAVRGFGRPGSPSHAAAVRDLVRGSLIDVEITAPLFRAQNGDRLTELRIDPVRPVAAPAGRTFEDARSIDLRQVAPSLASITSLHNVAFDPDGVRGAPGSSLGIDVIVPNATDTVFARVSSIGGSTGDARLGCGANVDDEPLADATDLAVRPAASVGRCSLTIRWGAAGLAVQKVAFATSGAVQPALYGRLWIPNGRFGLRLLRADGSDADPHLATIAGCAGRTCVFDRPGPHDVRIAPQRDDLALLVLAQPFRQIPPLAVTQTSALRWNVAVAHTTDVALTQFSDGNWVMAGDARTIAGTPCDIADTCFRHVPPGRYRIVHRWAWQLKLGIALTFAALTLACAFPFVRRATLA